MLRITIFAALLVCCLEALPFSTRPANDGRIVGGIPADISNYPYQVSLEYNLRHDCGASIISPDWVVTAAHCADGRPLSSIRFRAGSSFSGAGGSLHPASQIVLHPQYGNFDYDIAVIKVSVPFRYSNSVQPISLASVAPPGGTAVVVTGWGTLSFGGPFPSQLQQVQVNIVGRDECRSRYHMYDVSDYMICAGVPEGGKDACTGDSGGPLVAYGQLVGIVSWGVGCADHRYPGVYADAAALKRWVTSITGV